MHLKALLSQTGGGDIFGNSEDILDKDITLSFEVQRLYSEGFFLFIHKRK